MNFSRQLHYFVGMVALLLSCLMLNGCANQHTNQMELNIASSQYLNPNKMGNSMPLVVQFFVLSNINTFQKASIGTLRYQPAKVLKQSLLDYRLIEIRPNQKLALSLNQPNNARWLAVIGYYDHFNASNSQQIIAINHPRDTYQLYANTLSIHIQRQKTHDV